MALGPLHEAVFHVDRRRPSLFHVQTILCKYLNTLAWFCSFESKITASAFGSSKGGRLRSCTRGWVDVLRGCLGRHFYDPWFVDDASCAVSFLYNPNDPRLVALPVFWGLDLGTEAGGLFSGETNEETP